MNDIYKERQRSYVRFTHIDIQSINVWYINRDRQRLYVRFTHTSIRVYINDIYTETDRGHT